MAHSIIGFHYSTGGNKDGTDAWIASANQRGIPVGLKGVSDYGLIYEATEKGNQYGIDNWLVYRLSKAAGSVSRETPNYTVHPSTDAIALADEVLSKLPPEFDKSKVWIELINEPRGKATNEPVWSNLHPVDYLGVWCNEAAIYLNGKGYKFVGPSFNSGEPGDDGKPLSDAVVQYSRPGMLNFLAYCAANPNMAALAVHDYIWELPAPQYPQLWGRWEAAIAAADLAGIPRTFSIFVTEFGYSPSNAPSYPAVALDLDRYNQIAARFPQVKFAAAWTLQSGYDPVDDQVVTWTNYPIDKQFDPDQQPAVTHSAFGGTMPGGTPPMPDNLLPNPSFEEGHYNQNGVPELQFPNHWVWTWKTDSGYVRPEFRVQPRNQIPTNEWPLYFVPPPPDDSSWHTLKAFKQGLPIRPTFKLLEALNLPTGKYRFSFWIYPDIHTGVVNGAKQWSNNPDACKIRLFWNGVQGNWQSLHPYGGNAPRLITYEWQHGGGDAVVGFQADMPLAEVPNVSTIHNGIWTDAHDLRPVEAPPPPPPPPTGTFEERLWKASVQEQRTNGVIFNPALGLWKKILADGLHVVTHERPFEGVNYQVGEKPDRSERWVYTWTAADGIKRFKWPEDVPPPPFEFAAYPVKGRPYIITSPFNAPRSYGLHEGIDLSAPMGNPILAVANGVVEYVRAEDTSGYGLYVRVKHSDRFKTWYAHLQAVSVTVGQVVTAGQQLGLADSTGNSTGSHLHLTVQDLEQGLDGYVVAKVVNPKPFLDAVVSPPATGVSMPPYFLPPTGDYGDIIILKNNWGGGDERQQLQRVVNVSYVTKNQQWEKRVIASDGIYLKMDTSPGDGEYFTITGTPWMPLVWNPGDEWLRGETVTFYRKSDCARLNSYSVTNKIKFIKHANTWTSPTGIVVNDAIHLAWIINGVEEEQYVYAKGLGLVEWWNRAGKHSWTVEHIPVGQQGNNSREIGCFSS